MANLRTGLPLESDLRINLRRILAGSAYMSGRDAMPRKIQAIDISKGGMGVVADQCVQIGEACAIVFDVLSAKETRRVNIWAEVTYCLPQGQNKFKIGVRFLDFDAYCEIIIEELCQSGEIQAGW